MSLNETDHEKITNWLHARFPGGLICPLCRGDMWETNKADGLIASGPSIFLASCRHCGHVLLFSPELIKAPLTDPRSSLSAPVLQPAVENQPPA